MIFGGRFALAGAHATTAVDPSATPPKRALFAWPRHSPEADMQPAVKSSEQPQAVNKIHFIFNDWLQ